MYGQMDWMDPTAAKLLIKEQRINATLYVIDGADHHLYMDNPVDTIYKLLKDVFGDQKAESYLKSKVDQYEQELD